MVNGHRSQGGRACPGPGDGLRIFFKFRRKLLGELCLSAVKTLTVYFKALTGEELVRALK